MTGYYVLALVEGNIIYAMHDKVYLNEEQAKNALNQKKMRHRFNGKKYDYYDVWGISDLTKLR